MNGQEITDKRSLLHSINKEELLVDYTEVHIKVPILKLAKEKED